MNTSNPTGPWEESLREGDAVLEAVEVALELSPEERRQAVSLINSRRRQAAYKGGPPYQPLADSLSDPPRWAVAENLTGGPPPQQQLWDRIPRGTILDRVAPGRCLDLLPTRERKPLLRCDRCGCWPPKGWNQRFCPTCCGGSHPHTPTGTQGP